jgi:hypothetical protein
VRLWVIEYADSIVVFDISDVDIGVVAFLSAHAACRALADLVDRKKLLCVINLWLAAAVAGSGDTWLAASSIPTQIVVSSQIKGGAHA